MNEKRIGFDACINSIGREFYETNKERSVFACGDEGSRGLWCFLGINTREIGSDVLRLSADMEDWEYYASCYVKNGAVVMDKCRIPTT